MTQAFVILGLFLLKGDQNQIPGRGLENPRERVRSGRSLRDEGGCRGLHYHPGERENIYAIGTHDFFS